jgi:hypothetical protein
MPGTTKRLVELLETVNATAVNNDDRKPGESWPSHARRPIASELTTPLTFQRGSRRHQLKVTRRRNIYATAVPVGFSTTERRSPRVRSRG